MAQLQMLDILKVIDRICRHNKITYWLACGTLLGAIRHNGFIPWDDDIDIEILRKDRRRFIQACKKELPSNLHLQMHQTEPNCYHNILKIREDSNDIGEKVILGDSLYDTEYTYKGFFVDVFFVEPTILPLLTISNKFLYKILQFRYVKKGNQNICNLLWYLMKLSNDFFRLLGIFFANKNILYSGYSTGFGSECSYNGTCLFPVNTALFEGVELFIPSDADAYLKSMFGDYMKLPDSKQRVSHHTS